MQSIATRHEEEIKQLNAEMEAAPPYVSQVLLPEPEAASSLASLPMINEAKNLIRRLHLANPSRKNRILAAWQNELTESCTRWIELEKSEAFIAAEAARAAAFRERRVLSTCFTAIDDVMLIVVAEPPHNVLTVAGVEIASMPKPIAFVSREEWPALENQIAARRAEVAAWTNISERDKYVATAIRGEDRWNPRLVLEAFDVATGAHDAGFTQLDAFIGGVRDLRLLVKWADADPELAPFFLTQAADVIANKRRTGTAATIAGARGFWATQLAAAPEVLHLDVKAGAA